MTTMDAIADIHASNAARIEQLGEIIRQYNDLTEKLQHSHAQLQQTVQSLRSELSEKNRQLERTQAPGRPRRDGRGNGAPNPQSAGRDRVVRLDAGARRRPAAGVAATGQQNLRRGETAGIAGEPCPAVFPGDRAATDGRPATLRIWWTSHANWRASACTPASNAGLAECGPCRCALIRCSSARRF